MDLQAQISFPAGPDRVAALLADPDYVRARCVATGARSSEVTVTREADGGFRVTTSRAFPTDGFPSFARSMVGPVVTLEQVDHWTPADDGSWRGTSTVTTAGAPARFEARGRLEATNTGARQSIDGTITAPPVPLLGAKIEKMIHDQIMKAIAAEERLAAEWLAH
jgi:hypothetical protein